MSVPDAETIAAIFSTAMKAYSDNSTRSKQTRIGASQVGFCRQKTAYLIKETPPSDTSSMWAATVGTAIHHLVADALHEMMPTWIVETAEVTATLPSGYEILGHPDILVPEWNLCLDLKSVDGFEWIKRNGSSRSHQYQRHLYALGAIQQGILDGDRPVYVGNIYVDRSGSDPNPIVLISEFDHTLTDEINQWVEDVTYAVLHGEDASRDIPAAVCAKICEHFLTCRGGALPVGDSEVFTDPEILEAINMYVEGRETAAEGERQRKAASAILKGLNGVGNGYQVRTTHVAAVDVAASYRRPFSKVELIPIRDGK